MPVEIRNLTLRPVVMRLNSGASLHLSPGMTSQEIGDEEVHRNEKVEKLRARRVIELTGVKAASHELAAAKSVKPQKK